MADSLCDARQFLLWLVSMDDSEDVLGREERRTVTLTQIIGKARETMRQEFFAELPDLDYEVAGGTWEEPRWAFQNDPFFQALGLTVEECIAAIKGQSHG